MGEDHRKNLALEGLRGLACLNVVLAHYRFTFMPYAAHFLFPEGNIIRALVDAPAIRLANRLTRPRSAVEAPVTFA